jgi:tripartite-type tricarboxylate transporter receptor subunit TctC
MIHYREGKLHMVSFARVAVAALFACLLATPLLAQEYPPSKPVRIIVPFAAGGPSDILARVLAQKLSASWKQSVIVDNRAGAGGSLGASIAAKSAPDGTTLLLSDTGILTIGPSLYANLPYTPKDIVPVINLAKNWLVLVAPANSPLNSMADIIARDKAKPGSVNCANAGTGSTPHLAAEKLAAAAHVKMLHIPYKGSGPALNDVIAGQVDTLITSTAAAMPFIKGGKLKVIAVTSLQRLPLLPDARTAAESGLPGFEAVGAQGLYAPAGTSPDYARKLNAEVAAIIKQPDIQERWTQMALTAFDNTPEQFSAWLGEQAEQWGRLIKEAGVKAE